MLTPLLGVNGVGVLRADFLPTESVPPAVCLVIAEGEELERKAVGLGEPRQALQLVQGLIGVGLSFGVTVFGLLPELLIACEELTELVLFHCLIDECVSTERTRRDRVLSQQLSLDWER